MQLLDRFQMPAAIAEAISAIMNTVDYVQKKGENKFHNYKFAAVGDVMAKLQPAMAEHGLNVVQTEVRHEFLADTSIMLVEYEFLLSHKSGVTWGERPKHSGLATCRNSKGGFDDKAANKCHTAARKYFLMALFQIPTGDHVDPDEEEDNPPLKTDQKVSAPNGGRTGSNTPPPRPTREQFQNGGQPEPRKDGKTIKQAKEELRACTTTEQISLWKEANEDWLNRLAEASAEKHDEVQAWMDNCWGNVSQEPM